MFDKIIKYISASPLFTGKTPRFWHENGVVPQVLLPLSVVYFFVKRIISKSPEPRKFNVKVICVGNAIAGGAGKTPTAIAIYKEILKLRPGANIAFVSTGYKGRLRGPVEVKRDVHDFHDVGDEALLLAAYGRVIICKDRVQALELAESSGVEYAILDDGLHDKRIFKDITFLVIDGKYGFGNNLLIPAGPLRDRLDYAIEGTDHIILIGDDAKNSVSQVKRYGRKNFPVLKSFIDVVTEPDKAQIYVAFAGIGRPQKFFDMLKKEMKLAVVETVEFADHHNYTKADMEHLEHIAKGQKAKLVTTEKDMIKLPKEFADTVECVRIELRFEDGDISEVLEKL